MASGNIIKLDILNLKVLNQYNLQFVTDFYKAQEQDLR